MWIIYNAAVRFKKNIYKKCVNYWAVDFIELLKSNSDFVFEKKKKNCHFKK